MKSCVDPNRPLRTQRLDDGRRKLLCTLKVEVCGCVIEVPKGFVTDFSSIPSPARVLPGLRWSRVDVAGVVHDWLYATGKTQRACADEIWRIVAVSGCHAANRFSARLGLWGLRLGGGRAWRRHRARSCPEICQCRGGCNCGTSAYSEGQST